MTDLLVSIIIPIFNVEKYLDRCIESVVNQTYKNLEIILVDDGSTDSCPQMCDEWGLKDSRIKVVHKENAGLGMARNTGIDNASGEYIFFFDSDDYVDVTTVERCVKSAVENDSEVVAYGRNDVYDDGRIVPRGIKTEKTLFSDSEICNIVLPAMFTYEFGFGISSCGKMYKTELFNRLNKRFVSEKQIISEDAYFAIDLYTDVKKVSVVCENLYFYYKRGNSLTQSYDPGRQTKNDKFYIKSVELAKSRGLSEKVINCIAVRYQIYTFSAIKQVVATGLSKSEKKKEIRKIFKSKVLRSTLTKDIIAKHNKKLRLFYFLLKSRLYWLCEKMIELKVKSNA